MGTSSFCTAWILPLPLTGPVPPGLPNLVREVDLIGNTVKQITMAQLDTRLAAANYNVTLYNFHS